MNWLDQMSVVWIKTQVAFNVCIWEINANSRSWRRGWCGEQPEHLGWLERGSWTWNWASQVLDTQLYPAFLASEAYCCLQTKSTCSQHPPCQPCLNKLSKDSLWCVRRMAVSDWQHSRPHLHLHRLRQVSPILKDLQAREFKQLPSVT